MSVRTSKVDKFSFSFLLDFDELPIGITYLSEIRATALTFLQRQLYHIHKKKPSDFEKSGVFFVSSNQLGQVF